MTTLIVPGVLIEEGVTAPAAIDWRGITAGALVLFRAATPYGQTFSAGLALWDRVETPEHLLDRVDGALYQAKHGGRDRIVVAEVRASSSPGGPRLGTSAQPPGQRAGRALRSTP